MTFGSSVIVRAHNIKRLEAIIVVIGRDKNKIEMEMWLVRKVC